MNWKAKLIGLALFALGSAHGALAEDGYDLPALTKDLPPVPYLPTTEERMVIMPWEGVKPWKYKNNDPWVGYPEHQKPTPNDPWGVTVIRLGRPSDKLDENVRFYHEGLGLPVIMGFELHEGFKGAMFAIGEMLNLHPEAVHLEITEEYEGSPGDAPTDDNNMVFYIQDWKKIKEITDRMLSLGYKPAAKSRNPWWDAWCSITFIDPDGWNIVLHPKKSDIDHSEYHYMEVFDGPMNQCPGYWHEVMKQAVPHPKARS